MSYKGFSHVGLSTLDLDGTREFYEKVPGFKVVVADTIKSKEEGEPSATSSSIPAAISCSGLHGTTRDSGSSGVRIFSYSSIGPLSPLFRHKVLSEFPVPLQDGKNLLDQSFDIVVAEVLALVP
jgi:hypothetical protein